MVLPNKIIAVFMMMMMVGLLFLDHYFDALCLTS
jgi:hypothetical protein